MEEDTEKEAVISEENTPENNLKDKSTLEIETDNECVSEYDTLVVSGGSTTGILSLGALQFAYDNFILNNVKNFLY